MTKTKFILINKNSKLVENYRTLREIADKLNIEYHQVRSIYIFYKQGKKHMYPITKVLIDKYEIKDNPEYLNV